MESIRVDYSRRVSPAQYESVGIGGSIEFKPATDDAQKEFEQAFLHLKLIVDAKLAEVAGRSGGTFDPAPDEEPDLGEPPEWVRKNQEAAEAAAKERPIPPPPAPPAKDEDDDLPAMPAQTVKHDGSSPDGKEVYLNRAKVFRVNMKRSAKTSRVYAELRVGHEDLRGLINDQYVTVRVFDPEYAAVVGSLTKMKNEETGQVQDVEHLLIQKNDFVNLWGSLSAWTTDSSKFDLNATAIQKI